MCGWSISQLSWSVVKMPPCCCLNKELQIISLESRQFCRYRANFLPSINTIPTLLSLSLFLSLSLSLSLHRATLGVWANRPISQPAFRSQLWIRLNHKLNSVLWYCRDWEGLKSTVQRDTEVDRHIERSRKTETGNIKREEKVYNVKTQRRGERVKKISQHCSLSIESVNALQPVSRSVQDSTHVLTLPSSRPLISLACANRPNRAKMITGRLSHSASLQSKSICH